MIIHKQFIIIGKLFADRGDYESAIRVLNNGLLVIENDADLRQAITLNEQNIVNSAITRARALAGDGYYDQAINALNAALSLMPYNQQLLQVRDDIEAVRPINLLSLRPVRSNHWNVNSTEREVQLRVSQASSAGEANGSNAEYYISSRYSTLRGILSADERLNPNTRIRFRVFADDVLVFESDYIQRATEISFTADISGARFIRITVTNLSRSNSGNFIASDLTLIR